MIMRERVPCRASSRWLAAIGLLVLIALPGWSQGEEAKPSEGKGLAPTNNSELPPTTSPARRTMLKPNTVTRELDITKYPEETRNRFMSQWDVKKQTWPSPVRGEQTEVLTLSRKVLARMAELEAIESHKRNLDPLRERLAEVVFGLREDGRGGVDLTVTNFRIESVESVGVATSVTELAAIFSDRISSVKSFDVEYVTTGIQVLADTGTTVPLAREDRRIVFGSGKFFISKSPFPSPRLPERIEYFYDGKVFRIYQSNTNTVAEATPGPPPQYAIYEVTQYWLCVGCLPKDLPVENTQRLAFDVGERLASPLGRNTVLDGLGAVTK